MEITKETRIGAIAAYDYRTSDVFKNYHINFCSHGGQNITEVCADQQLSPDVLIDDLKTAMSSMERMYANFNYWPIDLLTDYIEKKHHRYAAERSHLILNDLYIAADLFGNTYSQLGEIHALFGEATQELKRHMKKEEELLFPYIRKMALSRQENRRLENTVYSSLGKPVREFLKEHDQEIDTFSRLFSMARNVQTLSENEMLFRNVLARLKEFETDLCLHIHLENNILFPKALEMENTVER